MSFLREFHSDLSILPLLLSPLPPPSLSPHSLSPPLSPLSLLLSLSPPLSPSSPFYLSVSPPPSSPSLLPPSLPLSTPLFSLPLFSLFLYSMCVSSQPDTHHWRGMQRRRCCVSHTPRHILTQHILLTVAILYSCLTSVAGSSPRCSSVHGTQCSFPRILYFYSSSSKECNARVTWDCGDVGFGTQQECETACGVITKSKF